MWITIEDLKIIYYSHWTRQQWICNTIKFSLIQMIEQQFDQL